MVVSSTDTQSDNSVPLCVDLDGTLVRTDMLFETLLCLIKQQPWLALWVPYWLYQGKATLKQQIAQRLNQIPQVLPFAEDVVDYVRAEKQVRKTILVTGSHQLIADSIAEQTGLFDEVKGSDADTNLTNTRKRDWLVERFGEKGFDYIGNDTDDLMVWPKAREALVVSASQDGIAQRSGYDFAKVFSFEAPGFRDYLKMLRVHQWSKNLLVLVPFVLDQRFGDWWAGVDIVLAFFAMSLLASMTYIFNDMLDLQADRGNETKAKRALPSGVIPLLSGFKAMFVLALLVVVLMFYLPAAFNLVLAIYLVSTLLYSFVLKRKAILDVTMIAALHTLRIIGGMVAINAVWSFWLLAFSMFMFFSLAVAKRVSELINLKKANRTEAVGRDYRVADIPVLQASGVATGYLSVLIVALYINSEKVQVMYPNPEMLWLVCPILLYWVGRLWLITARGELHEDPIIFAIRDRISLVTVGLVGWIIAMAIAL